MKRSLLFLFTILLACNKEDITGGPERKKAVVVDTGPVATDGCDWMLRFGDTTYYHPDNLPEVVKENDLDVWVDYATTTDSFYCGIANKAYPVIHIIGIAPR